MAKVLILQTKHVWSSTTSRRQNPDCFQTETSEPPEGQTSNLIEVQNWEMLLGAFVWKGPALNRITCCVCFGLFVLLCVTGEQWHFFEKALCGGFIWCFSCNISWVFPTCRLRNQPSDHLTQEPLQQAQLLRCGSHRPLTQVYSSSLEFHFESVIRQEDSTSWSVRSVHREMSHIHEVINT